LANQPRKAVDQILILRNSCEASSSQIPQK